MAKKLIIIRGNSGSGKSTVATKLRYEMGYNTMLISQDVIRREIIRVADTKGNPAIKLIGDIARYGNSLEYDVIIEGILAKEKYGSMLKNLAKEFDKTYTYYFDISFEETLKRHESKSNKDEFGIKELLKWWLEKDFLRFNNEYTISAEMSANDTVKLILRHISE